MIARSDAPRLRVAVVGTGRVGSVLGAAFDRAGHRVVAATGVSLESQRRVERMLPRARLTDIVQAVAAADLVLLTVPDDQLRDLIAGLATTETWRAGQLAVHTSGAYGIDVFAPATAVGVVGLALHPVMTFTGRPEDLQRLQDVPFGVTAAPEFRPVAETLALELGGEPVWVPDEARPRYHAALAIASNHLVTVINDAADVLEAAGVADGRRLITPLISASVDNALRLGDAGLTGPVSRGDAATVGAHVRALRGTPYLTGYLAMALRTMSRARAAGRLTDAQCAALVSSMDEAEADGP